jgi:polynucleotide 5'-kinase involved in rRNA processing
MAVFDWLRESKNPLVGKNPAGFLRKSIEEGYQPPEDYLSHKETEFQRQREGDRKERWRKHREELIKQDIANWDKTPPEERVSGRLDAWIFTQQASPTQDEIERKLQELIDSLPQTDEEKGEYILGDYPDFPPPDFE